MDSIIEMYERFQVPLFLSSITIGTFLFSMKTFIIQTLKKEVYDTEEHRNAVDEINQHYSKKSITYYRGLKNLSNLIFYTIISFLLNSVLNITIGNFPNTLTLTICFLTTIVAWTLLAISLFNVGSSMQRMIDFSESKYNKK